jgi:hypothetical protein
LYWIEFHWIGFSAAWSWPAFISQANPTFVRSDT